jgi:putative hydrolase of the HAD superfamily
MTLRAVLFDLDDTLYAEGDFYRSGFLQVALHLGAGSAGDVEAILHELEAIHHDEGRERVLDTLVARRGLDARSVSELVALFREHAPRIRLHPEVPALLARLRPRYRLGCVTDGWPGVQRRKVEALGLAPLVDTVVYAGDYGPERWKPSAFPFEACCALLGVSAREAVAVGDNPERDVRGARRAGIASVRIRREGGYFSDRPSGADRPDFEIRSLADLPAVLDALGAARATASRAEGGVR